MLEALIRTKESGGLDKFRGDVICIKLKETSDWGATEIRVHKVVDWADPELEKLMREELYSLGNSPVRITPYKISKECKILDEEGNSIYQGNITKTRSIKYFNFAKSCQEEKTEEEIENEFQLNKQKIKAEILKEKPKPPEKTKGPSPEEEALLYDYIKALKSLGIKSDIVDGTIRIVK